MPRLSRGPSWSWDLEMSVHGVDVEAGAFAQTGRLVLIEVPPSVSATGRRDLIPHSDWQARTGLLPRGAESLTVALEACTDSRPAVNFTVVNQRRLLPTPCTLCRGWRLERPHPNWLRVDDSMMRSVERSTCGNITTSQVQRLSIGPKGARPGLSVTLSGAVESGTGRVLQQPVVGITIAMGTHGRGKPMMRPGEGVPGVGGVPGGGVPSHARLVQYFVLIPGKFHGNPSSCLAHSETRWVCRSCVSTTIAACITAECAMSRCTTAAPKNALGAERLLPCLRMRLRRRQDETNAAPDVLSGR